MSVLFLCGQLSIIAKCIYDYLPELELEMVLTAEVRRQTLTVSVLRRESAAGRFIKTDP